MTTHLTDGQLRAALDGETSAVEQEHLAGCPACRQNLTALRSQVGQVAANLGFLSAEPEQPAPSAQAALYHFHEQTTLQKENSMLKRLFASSTLRFGLAALLLLAAVLAIPTTRALADQLLNLFRVQQVTVLPIDITGMQALTGDSPTGKQISELLSSSIHMTQKPSDPVTVADATQASRMTGFRVRLPADLTPTRISVEKGAAFSFKVDRSRAQALLVEAGRSDLLLPASIDGADISVTIPAGVSVDYGICPEPSSADGSDLQIGFNGSSGRKYADCVILAEIPSPTVKAPADVNVGQLAQIGLEFTGMTPEQAAKFTQSVDWTTTLVVPIPKNAATYQQVQVDGVTGTLIQRPMDDAPQFALLWVKNGVIYAIGGLGGNSQQAIQMANSLH